MKSTSQGVCIALGIGHNQQMFDSAFVLCIRADGMHRVEMGELDVVQAITWNDKIYSLACRNNDLVFVSDISGGNLSSLEVLPKYKGWFPMSISCIDGAFAVNDNANGVYIWNDSDVGAPFETTETIVYRYEEPTPTSSVGIEQHATPSQRLHPAYSRGDFITWLSHLEGTVEVCDTFGSTIDPRDVHPGCVLVRNENTTWVVMVLPE